MGSHILLKIFSESQFSGKTYFYTIAFRTKAGKMMVAVGKTMSYSGQQRLAIRVPLVRLYQGREQIQMSSLIATYRAYRTIAHITRCLMIREAL